MRIVVQERAFNPYQEMAAYEESQIPRGKFGGVVAFIGTMRDFNEGHSDISTMYLDHYPGMTEKHLERVCQDAMKQWDIIDTLVMHRVGKISVSDPIVLVGVWSSHRSQAFDASRFIINDLKHRAPFWKRETTPQGERWVQGNTQDVSTLKP